MAELQHIIPRPGEIRPDAPYRTPDRCWEEVTKEIYGSAELPQNIAFASDPDWRQRVWSIQRINDSAPRFIIGMMRPDGVPDVTMVKNRSWLWAGVFYLFFLADIVWIFLRMVR